MRDALRRSTLCAGLVLSFTLVLANNEIHAIDPPRELEWGMTYEAVLSKLLRSDASDAIDIKKLEKPKRQNAQFFYPDKKLLDGLLVAKLENVKLVGQKFNSSLAVFSDSTGLRLIQYGSNISEADRWERQWAVYQRLLEALSAKYGSPTRNQITSAEIGKDLPGGTDLKTEWQDSTAGGSIRLVVQNRVEMVLGVPMGNFACIYLEYASPDWLSRYKDQILQGNDDL